MKGETEMAEEGLWYVVHTYSGYENKVAQNLETLVENRRLHDLIQEVKVPTEIVPEIKDGVKREVERKLFPGYVLVKMVMTDDSWYVVRNTRGVTGFVGPSSKPIPLTQAEVDALGVETHEAQVDYKVGDNVEVTAGPLEGQGEGLHVRARDVRGAGPVAGETPVNPQFFAENRFCGF